MPILEIDHITRRFDDLIAVNDVSFQTEPGEIFGLVGPNGAGKSTLIKMLITLLPPSEGTARVAGLDIRRQAAAVRQVIGYVPQLVSADGDLTAFENLMVYSKLYDVPARERTPRIKEALALVGLSDVANKLARQFSGGMVRRLEIAQSVLHRPKLLFMDEPTVGLDPLARMSVWEHITGLRDQYGMSILLTTHHMEEAETLCGRVAIMHLGQVAAIGSPDELKAAAGPDATLDDAFVHFAGGEIDASVESFRQLKQARRTARRMG